MVWCVHYDIMVAWALRFRPNCVSAMARTLYLSPGKLPWAIIANGEWVLNTQQAEMYHPSTDRLVLNFITIPYRVWAPYSGILTLSLMSRFFDWHVQSNLSQWCPMIFTRLRGHLPRIVQRYSKGIFWHCVVACWSHLNIQIFLWASISLWWPAYLARCCFHRSIFNPEAEREQSTMISANTMRRRKTMVQSVEVSN